MTPPSVRFFGRYRFPSMILVLLSLLKRKITEKTHNQVKRHFGITVSQQTRRRWYRWWQECFVKTLFWKEKRSLVPTRCLDNHYPRILLAAFSGSFSDRLVLALEFLSPLTAGIQRAV